MRLQDKVAIVTGGGTGIGRAISERFASEGVRVAVNYSRSRQAAEEVAEGICQSGGEAMAVYANVASDAEVRALMREIDERWGRLDILVNNAGWSKVTPHWMLEDLTDEIWDQTLNTNLRGVFYCSRAAAPLLRRQQGASIVNVASIAAYTGGGSSMVYAASKAGVISMTKSFARILAPDVRVNAVAPGAVHTRFANWPEDTFSSAMEQSPLQRIATVQEVAATVLFLTTGATAITGETIKVDCGITTLRR